MQFRTLFRADSTLWLFFYFFIYHRYPFLSEFLNTTSVYLSAVLTELWTIINY